MNRPDRNSMQALRSALAAILWLADTQTGGAAVRLCEATVSSGPVKGATEKEARTSALESWKTQATAHGEGYGSWRLAADKILQCLPMKDGGFECLARAAPCTIEQAPARRELRQKRLGI